MNTSNTFSQNLHIRNIYRATTPTELLKTAEESGYNPDVIEYIPDRADEIYWDTDKCNKKRIRKEIVSVLNQIYHASPSRDFYRAISNRNYITKKEKFDIKTQDRKLKWYHRLHFLKFFFGPPTA